MRIRLKWVHQDTDRHGNVRVYFWRRGAHASPKVRIHEEPGSDAFLARYRELVTLSVLGTTKPKVETTSTMKPRTLGWLVHRYKTECAAYMALDSDGRRTRAGILKHIL